MYRISSSPTTNRATAGPTQLQPDVPAGGGDCGCEGAIMGLLFHRGGSWTYLGDRGIQVSSGRGCQFTAGSGRPASLRMSSLAFSAIM